MAREESRGKRPFKIWDGFRNIRKSLVASSLKDLEARGKEKLNIAQNEPIRLVLETDGTQIEDPEYFKTLPNNTTVLLLRNDEYWYPAGVDAIKTAIAAIPKIVCETIHALELQNETPSWKIMDNKGRVTVVLHWDQRTQHYRSPGNGMDASPSKKTQAQQQNGGLLMENNGGSPLTRRESEQQYQHHLQSVPMAAGYRHGSTPQITVIHHDAIPMQMADRLGQHLHQQQGRRLSKQGSSLDAAAIHVHTPECAHYGVSSGGGPSATATGSSRSSSPARGGDPTTALAAGQQSPQPVPLLPHTPQPFSDNGFECDFHCCALHEEGRRIAVHKSVATSPIQECHHTVLPPSLSSATAAAVQPASSSLLDGTRRPSPKGHVRFLDATDPLSPPLPPPPMLPPSPPTSSGGSNLQPQTSSGGGRKQHQHDHQQQQQQQTSHRSDDSSESETETTVIEDESMTSEKFLLLIDQLTGKQDKHLSVKDIGIILERLNSKIVDVERLDRDYEATDCYNWTIKATIRGDVLQELGIIYNGSYYGISEHPGYRQNEDGEEELANEDEDDDDVNNEVLDDDNDDRDGTDHRRGRRDDHHRRRADEEVNI